MTNKIKMVLGSVLAFFASLLAAFMIVVILHEMLQIWFLAVSVVFGIVGVNMLSKALES